MINDQELKNQGYGEINRVKNAAQNNMERLILEKMNALGIGGIGDQSQQLAMQKQLQSMQAMMAGGATRVQPIVQRQAQVPSNVKEYREQKETIVDGQRVSDQAI